MRKIFKFGDNLDTDAIIPAQFCGDLDNDNLRKHCMYNVYDNFYKKVNFGDVIVGGVNFGCGSSREMAPLSIKQTGIELIIAKSFSRIFLRNAINIGLQLVVDSDFYELSNDGDEVLVNNDWIKNINTGAEIDIKKQKKIVNKLIVEYGGLMNVAEGILNGEIAI